MITVQEELEHHEKAARECVDWIEERIKDIHGVDCHGVQHNKHLTPGDKWELEGAYSNFRSAFDGIVKNFIEPVRESDPILAKAGFSFLWRLTDAAFIAGARTMLSDSGMKYLNDRQTAPAREAIADATAERDKPLVESIINLARSRGITIRISRKCGGLLLCAGLETELTESGLEKLIQRNRRHFTAAGVMVER